MPKNTSANPRPESVLRLKAQGWQRECTRYNLAGDTAIAAHLRLPMTTYWRIRNRRVEPSVKFIKAALAAFPSAKFEDLFETVSADRSAA